MFLRSFPKYILHSTSTSYFLSTSKIFQPDLQRSSYYKQLSQADVQYFRTILPESSIITDHHQLEPYNISILKTDLGASKLVLAPYKVEQISGILAYCNDHKLGVVPQGGNTGLVGGNIAVFDEIVLSMKNINRVHKFDSVSSIITLDAGCVLQTTNNYLKRHGCEYPIDLGAKGSCHVGGNAATNAGGIYMVKLGAYRNYILGLEAVLPNGKILNLLSQNQKDNTGYDIKQLFIGSQGTLGMITKLNVLCPKFNPNRQVLMFRVNNYSVIIKMIKIIKQFLGRQLNALEYIDGITYKVSSKYTKTDLMDNSKDSDHFLLVEAACNSDQIQKLLEKLPEYQDAIMSTNQVQFTKIWKVRESIALAAQKQGRTRAYDISYDVQQWEQFTNTLRKKMPDALILSYGHIGDGNIHLNFCHPQAVTVNDEQMYRMVAQNHGSISAEHGLGIQKNKYLSLQKSKQTIDIYRQIKNVFDPNGIMNPYKMLPNE